MRAETRYGIQRMAETMLNWKIKCVIAALALGSIAVSLGFIWAVATIAASVIS